MKALVGSLVESVLESRVADGGERDRFAHYAPAGEVTRALVEGVTVVALCGKVWVPHRDPSKYKVCPTCKELYEGANA